MKQKSMLFATLLIASFANQQFAYAATFTPAPTTCAGLADIKPGEIYKYEPKGMDKLRAQGCPPPKSWHKAVNHELAAGGGATGFSEAVRLPAHMSSLGYKREAFCVKSKSGVETCYKKIDPCSNYSNTKAGGISDDGAVDPCKTGNGFSFFNIKIPTPRIPTIGSRETECMGNLIEQILNGGAVTVDMNLSGGCAVGTLKTANIGQCGIDSKSGSVCATEGGHAETASADSTKVDKPFARTTNPKYIPVSDVPTMKYINNPLNQMTAIYLPNGGTVTYKNNSYNLDAGMFVTMNANGKVFFGPNWSGCQENENFYNNCKIELDQAPLNSDPPEGSFVTITPSGGVVNVDSTIFEGQTLNKQTTYTHYKPTNNVDSNDTRVPTTGYDPRVSTVDQPKQTGPGAQNCISDNVADLAGLPPAQDGCVGAQRVGLLEPVLTISSGQTIPILQCDNLPSLFCVEEVNKNLNNNAPAAAQQQ